MGNSYKDWHSADIIAALKKRGLSLSALSRESGLSSSTLSNALVRPWTKGEKIIAQAIGMKPEDIWPTRYINQLNNQPINRNLRTRKKD